MKYLSDVPFNSFGGYKTKISYRMCKRNKITYEKDTILVMMDRMELVAPYGVDKRFRGKTYLLTSANTFSSAAAFSWAYKIFTSGIIVGEETGGVNICVGDVVGAQLPNSKFRIMLSCRVFYQYGARDGDPIHGTIPHEEVSSEKAMDRVLEIIGI